MTLPEPPMIVLAKVEGDVKRAFLNDPHWWMFAPAGVWTRPFKPDPSEAFFVYSRDLTVILHPRNDERAVQLIEASKKESE